MYMAKKTRNDETGLVSIIIVMTISIILSLMTIGFTRIMDRELRESIDLELATQAHYAAEAGVNDARLFLAANPATAESTDCLDLSATPFVQSISGDYNSDLTDNTVKYTCVIVDPNPPNLLYNNLEVGKSEVFKLSPSSPAEQISRVYFSWHNNTDTIPATLRSFATDTSNHPLPQEPAVATADDIVGLLRVTIYKVPPSVNNSTLQANARTFFLYPNVPGGPPGSAGWALAENGTFVDGNCGPGNLSGASLPYPAAGGRLCNAYIDVEDGDTFYVRITAVYKGLDVSVQASNTSNNPLELTGAQASIDSTGQGNDVLKRISVRVPLMGGYDIPEYAIKSMETLCKRLRIPQTGLNSFGDAEKDDPVGTVLNLDDVCLP